jgi:hypothetical protein
MNRQQLRDAALATPECIIYGNTGKSHELASKALHAAQEAFALARLAHEEASRVLHAAKAAFDLAGLADQIAERAYHSTPEFQALQNDWSNQ